MTADVIPLRPALDPTRVEITSPGMYRDGRRFYSVDIVDGDGASCMWCGADLDEARRAARECADVGDGTTLLVVDLTAA